MGLKNPSMIGQKSFKSVSQEVDEEQPQSCGKKDGTQHCSCLYWHTVSAQKMQNTDFVNNDIKTDKWLKITASLAQ